MTITLIVHDLHKDPQDLPPHAKAGAWWSVDVLSSEGYVVYFDYATYTWIDARTYDEVSAPDAWYELPKYGRRD